MAVRADDVDLGRDRGLVERFQAGDSAAFDDLYRRYFPRLYRFCLKRVGDSHEAEELAQEAFTRAYVHLGEFGGERRFYPWVSVIASRLCVDTHRRRARSAPSDQIDAPPVDGGQEAVLHRVDVDLLGRAFGQLAPRHREVLDLRERHGYSYQRIADHYGVSLGTVEALIWRARRALRREFLNLDRGEIPGLALFPAGLGLSRLAKWRNRVLAWLQANSQPVAAAVTALVVLGSTGALVGGSNGTAHAVTARPSVVRLSGAAPGVTALVLRGSVHQASSMTSSRPRRAGASGTPFVSLSANAGGVHASTEVNRTRADANPALAVSDTVAAVQRYANQLMTLTVRGGQ
jgi:RNA polymerase sigma-70 factor (ECF subfamily)